MSAGPAAGGLGGVFRKAGVEDARDPDLVGLPLSGAEPGGGGQRDFCPPVWLCVRPGSAERTDEGIQGVLPGVSEGAGFRPADLGKGE